MRTLYFDCFAGASGNMILGALLAAGVDRVRLSDELKKLNIAGFELEITEVDRSGISATHVNVKVPHEHVHRHLSDIEKIITFSDVADRVKARSIAIFKRLAEAEAKVHGIDIQKVHFHEVGAMDAIVDVVGSCLGFELLGIDQFACSKIHVGSGFVEMAHGKFPVPPPAVAELLTQVPVYSTELEGELMTPTGAAIISTLCNSYGHIPEMIVESTGYGAGTRKYDRFPNVLRVMVGESDSLSREPSEHRAVLSIIETNIDDISPQVLGFVMERAFETGALDCWFTPIQMKKNRPATMVSILCDTKQEQVFSELLYRETSTIGVRICRAERECLSRETVRISTKYGEIDVKIASLSGKAINVMPEYDQVRQAAITHDVPLRAVHETVLSAAAAVGEKHKSSTSAQ